MALRLSRENAASLFVWGDNSGIYLYAGKRSPSRFFQTFALSGVYASGFGQRRSELLEQFQTSPPSMIAIDPATSRDDQDGAQGLNVKTFPELQQFIAERYAALDNVGGGWQVFRLRA